MPSNKYPSSLTYPSDPGLDVHRSASFWLPPSTVSTPAKIQRSKNEVENGLKPQAEYPTLEGKTKVLKGMDKCLLQSLYLRLCAMGDACGRWNRVLAKSDLGTHGETAAADRPSKLPAEHEAILEGAAQSIDDAMKKNGLSFSVVVSEKSGKCYWKMFMDGILVGKGWAKSLDDMFTAGFYEREKEGLKTFM